VVNKVAIDLICATYSGGMAPTFLYMLGGSCGHTSIEIDVDDDPNTFRLVFSNRWMSRAAPEKINLVGHVASRTDTYVKLVAADVGVGYAEIFFFPAPLDFEMGDPEHECMCMANGARVNKDGRYNALLVLNFSADVPGAGDVWKTMVKSRVVKGARA